MQEKKQTTIVYFFLRETSRIWLCWDFASLRTLLQTDLKSAVNCWEEKEINQ